MNYSLALIASIILLSLGEGLSILAEILGAQKAATRHKEIVLIFISMLLVLTLAGMASLFGYIIGIAILSNIWIISIISISSILIIEPVLDYVIFKQLPTKGAAIGFVLGVLGFTSALLIR
jgi:ABC-type amino acid transport system permease subunit